MDRVLLTADRHNIEDCIDLAVQHGLGLEIMNFAYPDVLDGNWEHELATYRTILRNVPGPITLHGPFMDMVSGSPDNRINELCMDRYQCAIHIAYELDIKRIVLHTNFIGSLHNTSYREGWHARNVPFWRSLAEYARQHDVVIALENMWEYEPGIICDILKEVDHPNLRATLDVGHASLFSDPGWSLNDWINALTPWLVHIHMNNNNGKLDEHYGLDWQHGVLNYREILPKLRALDNKPDMVMEMWTTQDMEASLPFFQLNGNTSFSQDGLNGSEFQETTDEPLQSKTTIGSKGRFKEMLAAKLKTFDWMFIRGSSLNAIAIALGRVLGFAFSFMVARNFSTTDFGYVTYVLTTGSIMAFLVKPFGQHVFAFYIGKYRSNIAEFPTIMSHVWTLEIALFVLTLLLGIPIFYLLGRLSLGLVLVYIGVCGFYLYYGVAGGFQASNRLMLVYIGSNIVQLLLVALAIYGLNIRDTTPIIAIYGLSYFIPIAILLKTAPFDLPFRLGMEIGYLKQILTFSTPIWFSHILYVGFYSADILMLEHYKSEAEVGIYGLTKTLVSVFAFVPNGLTLLLMPKIAGMTSGRKKIAMVSLGIATVASLIGLLLYMLFYKWFVTRIFGPEYFLSLEFAFVAALGSILMGLHSVFTSIFVGIGKAQYETLSRLAILLVVLAAGFVLIPSDGAVGAAWMMLAGAVAGIVVFFLILLIPASREPLKEQITD